MIQLDVKFRYYAVFREFFLFFNLYAGLLLFAGSLLAANFYAGTSPSNVPWPGGVVPYEFTNTLTVAQQQTYLAGLHEWELAANVKFIPHTSENHWILFAYNTNGFDNVSATTNPQVVSVASLSRAQVCHEMGHSFGFNHENIRFDAANFITVLTENITPGNLQFFQIDPTTVTNGPYDFESVMHLGWDFASTQPGVLPTQQPKPPFFPRYQFRMGNFTLSPGDRAALKFLYGALAVPLTNIVTTTADFGSGSLRAAMYYVTDHPGSVVKFNIPAGDPGFSNGVFNIHLTGVLPTMASNGMVIDGSTQPGFTGKPLIVVDGSQILPETFTSNSGLLIYSASNQVKNISFSGFNWNGLTLEFADATNNTIAGCWLGLDSTGTNAAPNAFQGILLVNGAGHNIIGGTNALTRNVISGNAQYGIWMSDSNTTGNTILGNYIGTDASGSFAVPNPAGGIGMFFNSVGHVIGGTNSLARNVISGNSGAGIWLAGTNVTGNLVQGNFIGLNAAGTAAVPNDFAGIRIESGASSNHIMGNVISGNTSEGIRLTNADTTANVIQGNFIGTDSTGTTAVPNGFAGVTFYDGANSNVIGGASAAARNIISGNLQYGVVISDPGTSNNFVLGNYIGPDVTGRNAIGNITPGSGGFGIWIGNSANGNFIGGTSAGVGNVISGNPGFSYGVALVGGNGNVVQGNFVGTDFSGKIALPNGFIGVALWGGSTGNLIGGTAVGAGNVISGNGSEGLRLSDSGTTANVVQGNLIGTDVTGTNAIPNGFAGLTIFNGAMSNLIGGTGISARNIISGNSFNFGLIAANTNTSDNLVQGNYIGLGADGVTAVPNFIGVQFSDGATSNTLGGTAAGAGNTIAFNNGTGVAVTDPGTANDSVRGNFIFDNGALGIDLNNDGVTANDIGDADTGPNDLQNFPVITNAFGFGASTVVMGNLNSIANRSFFIDVYRSTNVDFTGYGEGQFYVGTASVTTDGSGNGKFAFTNNANYSGQYITTTATAAVGDTSEFSLAVLATNVPTASASFTGSFQSGVNGFTFALTLQTNFAYRIQAATNLALNPIPWIDLTNFTATNSPFTFTDRTATNYRLRFYRVVSP